MSDKITNDDASTNDDPTGDGHDRRSFLRKAAVGGAVAWTAPALLSSPAAAQGSPVVNPFFLPGSADTDLDGPNINNKSLTLSAGSALEPVLPGDLWVAYLSYDSRGTINVPAGWTSTGVASANSGGAGAIYSVESIAMYKVLAASDISGDVASQTFTATGADLTYGALRASAVVYRGSNLSVTSQINGTPQGAALTSTVSATFPANAASAPNVVLRLGAGRGYGGFTSISWAAGTGTDRVNYSSGNSGDRAQVINEQVDNNGASQNRTINVGFLGNRSRTTATLVITAA